ncbi:hypothetical protein DOK76_00010 [Vagococcus sp. DIV0080]|uniref:Prevent-host-death protein n=1 Tax=Candidatus Vagococcus giribetii TaxID=2230876 RepID=A0ABS3HQG4_9ENTE|nr:hypothetical protein [Vagococcus sp. DIV0080]MBO0475428.1 hypothetical protein [Vagococcus sp. DIV0080]
MTDKSNLDSFYLKEKSASAQRETAYLRQVGVLEEIEKNKDDETVTLGEIDWDNL